MKITYDYQVFSQQRYGGISRYISEIASRISNIEDFDVKVLAGLYVNKHLKNVRSDLIVGKYSQLIIGDGTLIGKLNHEISKIFLKMNCPHILHETYYSIDRISPANCKIVLTVYDMIHEKLGDFVSGNNTEIVHQAKIKAIERADHIICISNSTKIDLLSMTNVSPDKVSVIHLGHPNKLSFDFSPHVQLFSLPYLLFVGQRAGYKNFERLLNAYANHGSIKNDFKMVCFGADPFSREELNLIHRLGLNDHQVIHIQGDDQSLYQLYSLASAFIFPSLYEGFGIPLLEAMSLNCPVICSNTSSFPEVAAEAAEFFDPYYTDSISHGIENVVYNLEKRESMIAHGQKRVEFFSWDKCAHETSSIYRTLC